MEEDIKVLESLWLEDDFQWGLYDMDINVIDSNRVLQAIENLIKRNKELEEENIMIKNHIYCKDFVELNYIPNERLIHYMDVALENSKKYLKKGNKVRANEEYKRYKDLKDIVDDLVYHKTLIKGDK